MWVSMFVWGEGTYARVKVLLTDFSGNCDLGLRIIVSSFIYLIAVAVVWLQFRLGACGCSAELQLSLSPKPQPLNFASHAKEP